MRTCKNNWGQKYILLHGNQEQTVSKIIWILLDLQKHWFKSIRRWRKNNLQCLKCPQFSKQGEINECHVTLFGFLTEKEMRHFTDQKWGRKPDCWNYRKYFLPHPEYLKVRSSLRQSIDYVHLPEMSKTFIAIWQRYLIKMSVETAEWTKCTW